MPRAARVVKTLKQARALGRRASRWPPGSWQDDPPPASKNERAEARRRDRTATAYNMRGATRRETIRNYLKWNTDVHERSKRWGK